MDGKICTRCKQNPSTSYATWCLQCLARNTANHRRKLKDQGRRDVLAALSNVTTIQTEISEMEVPAELQSKLGLLFYNVEKVLNLVTSRDFFNDADK